MEPRLIPVGSLRIGHIVFKKQGDALNIAGLVTELKVGRPVAKIIGLTTPLGSSIRFDKDVLRNLSDTGLCIEGEVYIVNAFDCASNTKVSKATDTTPSS